MAFSTQELNQANKKHWCNKLGILDYDWEIYYSAHYEDIVEVKEDGRSRHFYPILFKWKHKGMIGYSVLIAPIVKSTMVGSFPFYYESYDYDMEKMQENAERFIKESKEKNA